MDLGRVHWATSAWQQARSRAQAEVRRVLGVRSGLRRGEGGGLDARGVRARSATTWLRYSGVQDSIQLWIMALTSRAATAPAFMYISRSSRVVWTAGRLIRARNVSSQNRPPALNAKPKDERVAASFEVVARSSPRRNRPERAMRKDWMARRARNS